MPPEPIETQQPDSKLESKEDFLRQGWFFHVQGDHRQAEKNFRKAISMDAQSIEGLYGLGLSLKLQNSGEEAEQVFQQTIELINSGGMNEHPRRATMLRHLAVWHIQRIQSGEDQEPKP